MALKRIEDLDPATTPLDGTELVELQAGTDSVQCTTQDIADLAGTPSLALDDLTDVDAPAPDPGDVLTWDDVAGDWIAAPPAGGGGAWGSISGTLSAQTDLQAALDAKGADRSTVSSVSSSSGVVTLDYALGDYFTLTLTENVTSWSISNPPGSGKGFTLMVQITQDSTPRTVAKPGTTAGGVALDVSTGSGDIDVLAISSFNNGTTLRSSIAKDFS